MFEGYSFGILGPTIEIPPGRGRGLVIGAKPAFFPPAHSSELIDAANSEGFMLLAFTSTHTRHVLKGDARHETTAGEVTISDDQRFIALPAMNLPAQHIAREHMGIRILDIGAVFPEGL